MSKVPHGNCWNQFKRVTLRFAPLKIFMYLSSLATIGGISIMPFVNVKLVGKLSEEQKAEISSRFTKTLEEVAGKPAKYVYIVFDEVERENWAMAGELFSQR
jgi:4-oxalocrotonate tautomerase